MGRRPSGFWKIKTNRIDAIRGMVEKSGKEVTQISKRDFRAHGLNCLLEDYYDNNAALAIKDAFGFNAEPGGGNQG